ncbi:MAG: 1-acyl-sn-glycerol-3-phosphate acyltransferase [Gammaproteobacteria bacterium]|nr:1-acyl-sn-glycerol-3-phosphate acyltransferase [Gammaproteobacteria bacterium]
MLMRIEFAWRWLTTAFSYLMFGLGGLLFTIVVLPVLLCLSGGERERSRRTQLILHRLLQAYVRMMSLLGVVTYQIEGVEKLRSARLILANHPSLLDVVFLISMVPNACCVVKGKLARNFFTRGPIKTAGYIMNEEAAGVIDAAACAMDAGRALIIFPEGTRTDPSGSLHFRRGAANLAIRTGSAITPVLVYCAPAGLTKNQRWYQVPAKRMHLRFLVMDQLSIDQYLKNPRPSRSARNLSEDLLNYFNRELKAHD